MFEPTAAQAFSESIRSQMGSIATSKVIKRSPDEVILCQENGKSDQRPPILMDSRGNLTHDQVFSHFAK